MAGGNMIQAGNAGILPYRAPQAPDPRGWEGLGRGLAALQQLKNQDLMRILEGVKLGLIDPDNALVQGTPGGSMFEKYFGVKPPEPVRAETQPFTTYPENTSNITPSDPTGEMQQDPEAAAFVPRSPQTVERPTGRTTGGFGANNYEQLKNFVAKKLARGEQVSPVLLRAAGFDKGKNYAEELILIQARNNPRLLREYSRLKDIFGENVPDEYIRMLISSVGGEDFAKGVPEIKGPTVTQQKIKAIGDYKREELAVRAKYLGELVRTKDRKLDQEEEQFALKTTGELLSRLSPIIGFDYAKEIVSDLANGKNLDEIPLPEEVKKRVAAEFARKQQLADARTLSAKASSTRANTTSTLGAERLAAQVQHWNDLFQLQMSNAQTRDMNNYIKNNLNVAFKQLSVPATRAEGEKNLLDIVQNQLGWTVSEPEGFQGVLEFVGQLFGKPGLGAPTITPPKTDAPLSGPRAPQKPFNPPAIKPRANSGVEKPKTANDLLKKYQQGGPAR